MHNERRCKNCGGQIVGQAKRSFLESLFSPRLCSCPSQGSPSPNTNCTSSNTPECALEPEDLTILENVSDKYEPMSLLGRGGMGSVYKVRHKLMGKVFAVKILDEDFLSDDLLVKRFRQEAQAASKLAHPNLVSVVDFGVGANGSPYLVMDLLLGPSLSSVIRAEATLSVKRAIDIFIQLSDALVHAHAQGIIHRDIKPSNIILVREDGKECVKVVDFGIAKIVSGDAMPKESLTRTGEVFGSPYYMSPEQCQAMPLDARSDIYSMGCVMYEVLSGEPPMKGKNAVQTVLKHLNDPPQPFSKLGLKEKIPSDLEKIILHCLEKSPALRYSSVVELGKDLRRLSDGKPISLNTIGSGITATSKYLWSMTIVMASLLALCWLLPTLVNTFSPSLATKIGKGSGIPQMDAERLDQLAFEYFVKGDYERAIPLLEFGIKTYQDKSLKNRQTTTFQQNTYLADNYQHIGLCYLRLKKAETAASYYQKALIIYKSIGNNKNTMMSEAVENYAEVLRRMNKSAQAQVMLDEFRQTGNITTVPGS